MKAQGATEYLVTLGAILFMGLIVAVVLFFPIGSTNDAKQSQRDISFGLGKIAYPELAQGLITYYKLDEGVGDSISNSVGNVNYGTLVNGTWVNGMRGKAVRFSGTGYIFIKEGAFGAKTFTCWFNVTSAGEMAISSLMFDTTGGAITISSGRIYVHRGGDATLLRTSNAFNDGKWHFLAISYTGASYPDAYRVWVDGAEQSLVSSTGYRISNETLIGARRHTTNGYSVFFTGTIDDVHLYNRVLPQQEIELLYKNPGYP